MGTKITDKLISLFHLDKGDKRKNCGYFVGGLSIIVNLLISAVKLFFGIMVNSIALIADAVHSLSDVASSLVVIIGFRISAKPPDEKHPFGHGRAERIVAVVIACMLIVVGIEFFMSGIKRFRNPVPVESSWLIIVILAITIIAKILLSVISYDVGKQVNSAALKADAWHHGTDAISTILVIIGFVLYRFGFYRIDGLLGIIIALFIAYTGIMMIFESGSMLLGEAPSDDLISDIRETAICCEDVNDVHHIHVHDYGGKLEITVHIRLRRTIHLDEVHRIVSLVELAIKERIKGAEVTVHPEPIEENNEDCG
jgi:cation diffusion facilitator family transporter